MNFEGLNGFFCVAITTQPRVRPWQLKFALFLLSNIFSGHFASDSLDVWTVDCGLIDSWRSGRCNYSGGSVIHHYNITKTIIPIIIIIKWSNKSKCILICLLFDFLHCCYIKSKCVECNIWNNLSNMSRMLCILLYII